MLQPRVIVTTDPELDDLNSMLRLLLYSNEIDLVGLVYCSSEHHYRGDPASGVTPKRWPAESDTLPIDQAIAAYAEVHHNLVAHDHRYPSPAHLASLVRMGNVANVGDMEHPTPGSDLIAEVLLDDNPRPVFVQAWGGMNTIARALRSIEDTHIDRPEWPDIYERVTNKTVMTGFGFQDSTYEDYIEGHWPEIEHRQVATMVWGYFAWNVVPDADAYRLSAAWTREHVSNVGPMGAAYRVWGDGGQMAAGFDDEDYFGIAGRTREELRGRGLSSLVSTPRTGFVDLRRRLVELRTPHRQRSAELGTRQPRWLGRSPERRSPGAEPVSTARSRRIGRPTARRPMTITPPAGSARSRTTSPPDCSGVSRPM
ncbi:MAG: DUF1593 domain-containing protein [Acidimicrobiales bacterium]